ncbi:hypothetical protein [Thiofilum flexile]|uniref:hypothetical protein n=1 Tax=Thiofilum flexile TaxID=125627 RepID=UPI00036B4830|nr:hypothetical protein [Thiofilum flexile]
MKVALLLLLGLLNASTCVQAESTMNTPIPIDGSWNNGSEQITQSKTHLTVYVDHKRRGPFRGRFYKFQDGEQLIFVDFTDDTGCCTGRINTSGKTIVWSNNSTWTKDTVAATFPLHPITIVPPRLNPVNPPTPVVPPRPVEVIPPPGQSLESSY